MLDGLERADRAREHVALERIGLGHFEAGLRAADLLEGHRHRCDIEDRGQRCGAAKPFGWRGIEHDFSLIAERIQSLHGLHLYRGLVHVDDAQGDLSRIVPTGHERDICMVCIDHRQLDPADSPVGKRRLDLLRLGDAGALGQRKARDDVTRCDAGQPAKLLGIAAVASKCLGNQADGASEGNGREHPSDFFSDHAKLQAAQTDSAERSRDGRAQPPQACHVPPQFAIEQPALIVRLAKALEIHAV